MRTRATLLRKYEAKLANTLERGNVKIGNWKKNKGSRRGSKNAWQ
jgi:hypothetical protein